MKKVYLFGDMSREEKSEDSSGLSHVSVIAKNHRIHPQRNSSICSVLIDLVLKRKNLSGVEEEKGKEHRLIGTRLSRQRLIRNTFFAVALLVELMIVLTQNRFSMTISTSSKQAQYL